MYARRGRRDALGTMPGVRAFAVVNEPSSGGGGTLAVAVPPPPPSTRMTAPVAIEPTGPAPYAPPAPTPVRSAPAGSTVTDYVPTKSSDVVGTGSGGTQSATPSVPKTLPGGGGSGEVYAVASVPLQSDKTPSRSQVAALGPIMGPMGTALNMLTAVGDDARAGLSTLPKPVLYGGAALLGYWFLRTNKR